MEKAQLHTDRIVLADEWANDTSIEFPREISALIEDDPTLQIYGLFDGSRRADVLGLNDLDTLAPEVAAAPLFQLDAAEGEAGPWLLSFGRGKDVQAAVLRDHFCRFHGQGVGVLLLTAATEPMLRSHLRGLVKVARNPGTMPTVFLRYWDPVVANEFLTSLAPQPARFERLFFTQEGLPIHFVSEQTVGEMLLIHVSGKAARTGARKFFSLDPSDDPVMERIARIGLENNLNRWLGRDYVDELFPQVNQGTLGPHILREGARFGFTRQDEFAYLGHLMVHFGGWFHQSDQTPLLTAILEGERRAKQVPLRAAFSDAWAGSHRAVLRDFKDQLLSDARLCDGAALTRDREALAACLQAHIPLSRQGPFQHLWKKSQGPLAAARAPDTHWACLAFLSLFWGYKFYEDPFLGRSNPPQTAQEWDDVCNDFWKALSDV